MQKNSPYLNWLYLFRVLLLAGLYILAGEVSFYLSVSHSIVTLVIFAAEGFALAAVILWGKSLWLGVCLGQFVLALINGLAWHTSLGIALINSIEAWLGVYLFRHFALQASLNTVRDLAGLLILIFFILQPFSATLGTGLLHFNHIVKTEHWATAWLSWWFGNALGQALITPLVLSLITNNSLLKQKLSSLFWLPLVSLPIIVLIFAPISSNSLTIVFTITVPVLILFTMKGGLPLVCLSTWLLSNATLCVYRAEINQQLAQQDISLLLDLNTHLLAFLLTGQFISVLLVEFKQLRFAEAKAAEQLQRIADHFPGIIYEYRLNTDGHTSFPYASKGIESLCGITAEQVKHSAEPLFSKIHADDMEKVRASIAQSAQQLTPWQCEYRLCFDNGETRWFSGRSSPSQDSDGAIVWHGFVVDTTEIKKRDTEYQTIIEASTSGFSCTDLSGRFVKVNSALCQLLGYSETELLNMTLMDIEAIESPEETLAHIQRLIQTGQDHFETQHRCKDGRLLDIEVNVLYLRDLGQRLFSFFTDITERKRMAAMLQEQHALLKTSQRAARLGHCVVNLQDMSWTNDELFDDIVGIDHHFVRTFANWLTVVHHEDLPTVNGALENMFTVHHNFPHQDSVDSISYRIIRPKDGKECWIEAWAYLLYDATNQPVQMIGTIQDITERKQLEQALRNNEAFTLSILNSLTEHIVVLDEQGKIIMFNQAWQHFAEHNAFNLHKSMFDYNYLQVCQCALTQHYDTKTHDLLMGIQQVLSGKQQTFQTEYECHAPDEKRWFFMTVSPLQGSKRGVVISHENITQRKLIENALLDSQALLQTAQKAARMGHYVTDISTGTWTNDAMFDEVFGIDVSFSRDIAHWQALIHSDDTERVISYFQETASLKEPYPSIEYRIIRPKDGAMRWVAAWGHNFYDDHGKAYQQVGMLQDITERKLNEQQLQNTTEQLQLVLAGGHLGFWDWNTVTGEVQRNAIWAEILGYSHQEIQQTTQQWEDFVYIEDRQKAWQSIYDALDGKTPYHELEYRMLHKDGSLRWILDHASVVQRDNNGKPLRMSGTHTDVTRSKQLAEQLRASENFFQSLAQISPVGIYRTDVQGQCMFINRKGCELIGMSETQVLSDGWAMAVMPDDREKVLTEWQSAIQENRDFLLEYRFQHSDGKIIWVYGQATMIYEEYKHISGYVGTITDITERKATEAYINHFAFHDALTQLPNRRLLRDRMIHAIELNRRTGQQMAVLMLDLDKFKPVNDNLGHAAGDELLKQVGDRIKARLREVDTVARLGGDEFVALIENIKHTEHIAHIAAAIIQSLEQPFNIHPNHQVHISTSIGIAIHPEHGDDVDTLLDNADAALYHAKDQGRGCFAYFSEILTQKAKQRIALETRLRKAIEQHQLLVHFQPQIAIDSGQLVGAEALVRWYDETDGYIFPDAFIPLAEDTGLILAIGEWVLRETCRIGKAWLNQGLPPITLAVNVSPYQFRRCDINLLVTQILAETGFPACYLELEITESGLMDNQEHAMTILNSLRQQGIRLAIDDFGTGYSSLAYLKYFPLDILKIDKAFIHNIPQSQDDIAITSTIIAMAHHLGFKVLAEGVENHQQLLFLQQHECDMYQGYLYSEPVSAMAFEKMLLNYQSPY